MPRLVVGLLCLSAGVLESQTDSTVAAVRTTIPAQRSPVVEVVASAVLPGAGQVLQGSERGAIYVVAEALFLTRAVQRINDGRRERDRYRTLALQVARSAFGGVRTDTAFSYYDKVGKFIESGPFSEAAAALAPPSDTLTFNGSVWLLARRTFLADPDNPDAADSAELERALEFYREHSAGPEFVWSWRNAGLEQDVFRQSIRASDDAFRRATTNLGLLLANHMLSAADAFVSRRIGSGGGPSVTLIPANSAELRDFWLVATISF